MAKSFRRAWTTPSGQRRESAVYFHDYTDRATGRRVIRKTSPPTTSKRVAGEQLHAILAGGRERGPAITVADVMDGYEDYLRAHAASTARSSLRCFRVVRAMHGKLLARDYGLRHVAEYEASLRSAGLAQGTISRALGIVRAAFRRARAEGALNQSHPVCLIPTGRLSPERHVTWTDAELHAVTALLPPWAADVVWLMRRTGLRVSDALALRWESVDIPGQRLSLYSQKPGRWVEIPLGDSALALLATLPRRDKEWVFPTQRGKSGHQSYVWFARLWQRAMVRLGDARPKKTVHDIRRTFATQNYNHHGSKDLTARLLGQSGTRMVSRYARFEFETLRKALVD